MILKNCRYVVTQNINREILENKDIFISDNIIESITSSKKIKEVTLKEEKEVDKKTNTTIDCSNKIVIPGLINLHTHIAMHSLRGLCDDEELNLWLKKVVEKESKFDESTIAKNSESAINEMIRYGTTTFVDMYYPIKPIIKVAKEKEIRCILGSAIYSLLGNENKQFNETIKLIKNANKVSNFDNNGDKTNGMAKVVFAPHSIYTCSEKLLKKVSKYCNDEKQIKIIHLAETRNERVECFKKHKKLPLEYLDSIGFLDSNTILVHSIWLTKGELDIIKKRNCKIVHCPVSNMKLASGGVMPLTEMHNRKILVGLGTDSVVSNNNLDMFEEMKVCGLLHKQHRWDATAAPVQKILDMTTIDAAKIIGMESQLGSIEKGKFADIITLEMKDNLLDTTKKNVLSNLVYSASGLNVSDVIVNGKLLHYD